MKAGIRAAIRRLERSGAVPRDERHVGADGMRLVEIHIPTDPSDPDSGLPPNTRRMTDADHRRLLSIDPGHIWIPEVDDRPEPGEFPS